MEMDKKIKEDLKTVALGTSKINYLDPRITVAWCKRHEVPIEKVYSWDIIYSSRNSLSRRHSVTEPFPYLILLNSAVRFSTNHFLQNSDGQWTLIQISDSRRALLVAMFQPVWSSFQPFSRILIAARKGRARCLFFKAPLLLERRKHPAFSL